MNLFAARPANDRRLAPLLEASSDAARDVEIVQLLDELAPVTDGILARASSRSGALRGRVDDVRAEVVARLFDKLRAVGRGDEEVAQLEDYVAALVRNRVHDLLRAQHPERSRLKKRVRTLIAADARFASWEDGVCGLPEWRGHAPASLPEAGRLPSQLPEALLELFRLAGGPLRVDDVVSALMEAWNIAESSMIDIDAISIADDRPTPLATLETRAYLTSLWSEIGELRAPQRTALLLNLRDHNGGNALVLFVLLGIAGIDRIAAAIGMSAEELSELWNDLPLDDATIAARLGVTRQQVINLRKSARERLRRRLQT